MARRIAPEAPARKPTKKERRAALEAAVTLASRESSSASVLLHTMIAERMGLSATDEKTMEILDRLGPRTAGELATHTGLATASVTSLIDRLEKRGFVRRTRDPGDRRRVIVELTGTHQARFETLFRPMRETMRGWLDTYDDEQLETVIDFLSRGAALTRAATAKLSATKEDPET